MIDTILCLLVPIIISVSFLIAAVMLAFTFYSIGYFYYKSKNGKMNYFKYMKYQIGDWF